MTVWDARNSSLETLLHIHQTQLYITKIKLKLEICLRSVSSCGFGKKGRATRGGGFMLSHLV
jgi:hypothetical protein